MNDALQCDISEKPSQSPRSQALCSTAKDNRGKVGVATVGDEGKKRMSENAEAGTRADHSRRPASRAARVSVDVDTAPPPSSALPVHHRRVYLMIRASMLAAYWLRTAIRQHR